MGFLGGLKKVGGALLGGGGSKGYTAPYLPQNEAAAQNTLGNRLGASRALNPKYKPGSQKPGEQQYNYDYSSTGQQVYGQEQGGEYNVGGQSYDLNPINEAIAGYRNPTKSTAKVDPYQFNFASLPQQYFDTAYESGAKGVRREGQGQLQKVQSAIGTRRPGLLLKAAQNNSRNVGEQLASLRSNLGQEQIRQGVETGRAQQQAQAGENMNASQFNRGVEKDNSDEVFRYLQGLEGAGQNKVKTQSGLLGGERDYQDQAIQYLLSLIQGDKGAANQGASINNANRKINFDSIGKIASSIF